MTRTKIKANIEIIKLRIYEKFGIEKISEAIKQYCTMCVHQKGCNLLPITSAGSPCSYYSLVRTIPAGVLEEGNHLQS